VKLKLFLINLLAITAMGVEYYYMKEMINTLEKIMEYSIYYIIIIEVVNYVFKLEIETLIKLSEKDIFFIPTLIILMHFKKITISISLFFITLFLIYTGMFMFTINYSMIFKKDTIIKIDLEKYNYYYLNHTDTLKLLLSYPKTKSFYVIYVLLKGGEKIQITSVLNFIYKRSMQIPNIIKETVFFINELIRRSYLKSKKKMFIAIPFIMVYEMIKDFSFVLNERIGKVLFMVESKKIIIINRNILFNNLEKELQKKIFEIIMKKGSIFRNMTGFFRNTPHAVKAIITENNVYGSFYKMNENLLSTNYTSQEYVKIQNNKKIKTEKEIVFKKEEESNQYKFLALNNKNFIRDTQYNNFFRNNEISTITNILIDAINKIDLIAKCQNLEIMEMMYNGKKDTNMLTYQQAKNENLIEKDIIRLLEEILPSDCDEIIKLVEITRKEKYNTIEEKTEACQREL
jgi:hypothetical protein